MNCFDNYNIGENDRFGHKIVYIYSCTQDYIIYESENNKLHYDETNGDKYSKKLSAVSFDISVIKILAGDKIDRSINTQIALAWKDCFDDNLENSKRILQSLTKQLLVKGKLTYVISSIIAVTLIFLIAMFINYTNLGKLLPLSLTIPNILVLGSLGGIVSVLSKLNDLFLDPHSKKMNLISGASRIIISSASALLFYLAYKSKIIFGMLDSINPDNEMYFILTCSFVFGFAERFIPELANQITSLIKKN